MMTAPTTPAAADNGSATAAPSRPPASRTPSSDPSTAGLPPARCRAPTAASPSSAIPIPTRIGAGSTGSTGDPSAAVTGPAPRCGRRRRAGPAGPLRKHRTAITTQTTGTAYLATPKIVPKPSASAEPTGPAASEARPSGSARRGRAARPRPRRPGDRRAGDRPPPGGAPRPRGPAAAPPAGSGGPERTGACGPAASPSARGRTSAACWCGRASANANTAPTTTRGTPFPLTAPTAPGRSGPGSLHVAACPAGLASAPTQSDRSSGRPLRAPRCSRRSRGRPGR